MATLECLAETAPTGQICTSIDRYGLGTTALYTGKPLDQGPTIAPLGRNPSGPHGVLDRPEYLEGGIERFRKPEWDILNGNHMNYEITIPGSKRPITNVHIPMGEE